MVSFETNITSSNSTNKPSIAAFWANIKNVTIYYTEMTCSESDMYERQQFLESKGKIMDLLNLGFGCSLNGFNPTHILLITWHTRVSYSYKFYDTIVINFFVQ